MKDYLNFKKMITPIVIQILFWIGTAISILLGLALFIRGLSVDWGGVPLVLQGLALIFIGPVLMRIYCEILIVIFSINNTLIELKSDLTGKRLGIAPFSSKDDRKTHHPDTSIPVAAPLDLPAITRIVKDEAANILSIENDQVDLNFSSQLRIPLGTIEDFFQSLDENHGLFIPHSEREGIKSVTDTISYLSNKISR